MPSARNKIKILDAQIDELEGRKLKIFSNTLVKCIGNFVTNEGCGKSTKVKNLTYIQTHCYIEPRGCTEGDYWRSGEGNFICPKCGYLNRLYNRKNVEHLKEHFKDVVNTYNDFEEKIRLVYKKLGFEY